MQVNQSHRGLQLLAVAIQIILAMLVAYLFTQQYINLYYYQWAALAAVIILFIKGGPALNPDSNKDKKNAWVRIISFQLLLLLTFYGMSPYFGQHSFSQTLHYNLTQLGLAPFPMMLLVAFSLRKIVYNERRDATLVDIIQKVIPIKHGNKLWTLCHISIRQCPNFMLILMLTILSLNLSQWLTNQFTPFTIQAILVSAVFAILGFINSLKPLYRLLIGNKRYLCLAIPGFAAVLGLLSAALATLFYNYHSHTTQIPALIHLLHLSFSLKLSSQLFSQSWWLGFAIFGGIFTAHQSRSLPWREIATASLVVPITLFCLLQSTTIQTALIAPHWTVILGFLGAIGVLYYGCRSDNLPCLNISYLPLKAKPKQRMHQIQTVRTLRTVLFILFFIIPIGVPMAAFISSVSVMPFIEISLIILCHALLK